MSKYYGFDPEPTTKQVIEKFENEVVIRHNNQILVGTVYVDMQNSQWAVAMAYNHSRHPGLHGHENMLEVKYSYSLARENVVRMFRSDPLQETPISAGSFTDPNAFVKYVITNERMLLNRPA